MDKLIMPKKLKKGDTVALLSLSQGIAGDKKFHSRYEQGKKYLQDTYNFNIKEGKFSLKGSEFTNKHPELRAEDLMNALKDPTVDAIISNIGGFDSHKLYLYVDKTLIKDNPKTFIGYSDTTSLHYLFLMNGVQTFYGPSVMATFAENGGLDPYTKEYFEKAIMSDQDFEIHPSTSWTGDFLDWTFPENNTIKLEHYANQGYIIENNPHSIVKGKILGGCVQTLYNLLENELLPEPEFFKDCILFLEVADPTPKAHIFQKMIDALDEYIEQSVAIVHGRSFNSTLTSEQIKILAKSGKPVLGNFDIGHTNPIVTLPFGGTMTIDFASEIIKVSKKALK